MKYLRSFLGTILNIKKDPEPAMAGKRGLGEKGERIACDALKNEGYRIIEKNFRCRQGEIDIVAEEQGTVCFVEVKARYTENFGLPEEAVTKWKQKKLLTLAFIYLDKRKITPENMRFDIVSVDLKTKAARIIRNAFEADL